MKNQKKTKKNTFLPLHVIRKYYIFKSYAYKKFFVKIYLCEAALITT